jgi:hypothetical protein
VLKLIYQAAAFGPIDLEYHRPVVRVGSSEDNDLVLRHPSVEPRHCLLVFRGEKVLCLPPHQAVSSQTDLGRLTGPEFGSGDSLTIGELQFRLAHSSGTVAVPEVQSRGAGDSGGEAATGIGEDVSQRRYYCEYCKTFIQEAELKHMGLVGRAKRKLCPKCSRVLESEPEPQKPPPPVPTKQPSRFWRPGGAQ